MDIWQDVPKLMLKLTHFLTQVQAKLHPKKNSQTLLVSMELHWRIDESNPKRPEMSSL